MILNSQMKMTQLMNLPYEVKITRTKALIRHMVSNHPMYISRSGIDSIVMSAIIDEVVRPLGIEVPSVFANTGQVNKSVLQYATKYTDFIVYPTKKFPQVLKEHGYPIVSKEQAHYISDIQTGNISDKLKDIRLNGGDNGGYKIAEKWKYLIDADFLVSHKCCYFLKEYPLIKWGREHDRYPFIGIMADESELRKQSWKRYGCNILEGNIRSRPIIFWTKQDVLRYAYENNIEIPDAYGEIKLKDGIYYNTGVDRTGCEFCGFGMANENGKPNNFTRLKEEDKNRYDYIIGGGEYIDGIWKPNKKGLGFGHVLDVYGVNYKREDEYNIKYNEQLHRKFKAVSPNNNIYYHYSVNAFAYLFDLVPYDINHCLDGEYNEHKGWTFELVDGFQNGYTVDNCNDRCYELRNDLKYNTDDYKDYIKCINKDGEVYYTSNQSKFAKKFKLYRQSIYDCLKGKQKTHKKWKFERVDVLPSNLVVVEDDIYKDENSTD